MESFIFHKFELFRKFSNNKCKLVEYIDSQISYINYIHIKSLSNIVTDQSVQFCGYTDYLYICFKCDFSMLPLQNSLWPL